MIVLPPEPSSGENILLWAREVQKCLRRLRLTSGPGIRLTESPNSTTISADSKGGRTAIPTITHPFQLLDATTAEDGVHNYAVRVVGGTLAGLLPEEMEVGDDPPCIFANLTGTGLIYGKLNMTSAGAFTSANVEQTNGSLPANTGTELFVTIGYYHVNTTTHRVAVSNAVNRHLFPDIYFDYFADTIRFNAWRAT